jgi:hypothetical protein
MTGELPRPGSVWRQTALNRQMRVVFSSMEEIIAHDAEMSDRLEHIVSWVGTADEFIELFEPGDSSKFPQTAKA